jgi:hypothetical protein
VVFLFAKAPEDTLAGLAKAVDKKVAENAEKKLSAVMLFTGDPTDEYKEGISKFAEKHNLTNVTLAVTGDAERFKVTGDADVTVLTYVGKTVKGNFAAKGEIDDKGVEAVTKNVDAILE